MGVWWSFGHAPRARSLLVLPEWVFRVELVWDVWEISLVGRGLVSSMYSNSVDLVDEMVGWKEKTPWR